MDHSGESFVQGVPVSTDNSSGSPSFVRKRRLRHRTLKGSLLRTELTTSLEQQVEGRVTRQTTGKWYSPVHSGRRTHRTRWDPSPRLVNTSDCEMVKLGLPFDTPESYSLSDVHTLLRACPRPPCVSLVTLRGPFCVASERRSHEGLQLVPEYTPEKEGTMDSCPSPPRSGGGLRTP